MVLALALICWLSLYFFLCEVSEIETMAIVWSENGELYGGRDLLAWGLLRKVYEHVLNTAKYHKQKPF